MEPLSRVPFRLVAGTTVVMRRLFESFSPIDGWAYKLHIVGAKKLEKDGVGSGSEFEVTLAAVDTATLTAGSYRYSERVTKGVEVHEVGAGRLEVALDLSKAAAGDYRSHARKVLDAIEAVIAGTATKDQQSYQIKDRALVHYPLPELVKFRHFYRDEVRNEEAQEQIAQGFGDGRRIGVRFARA